MTDSQKSLTVKVAIAVLGLVAGFYVATQLWQNDEDRPPIVVKSGSLYFDHVADGRPGQEWELVSGSTTDWQPNHPGGKKVSKLQLYFVGGSVSGGGLCEPVTVTTFTVNFDPDGPGSQLPKTYTVGISTTGKPVPRVSGDLQQDLNNPKRLIAGTEGTIDSVAGESVTSAPFKCDNPTGVWVEPIK